MKKFLYVLLFTGFVHAAHAQNPVLYLGTKTPYQPQQTKYTPPPKGYKPVFINHVGRHGARFLTKPGSDVLVQDVLIRAGKNNMLTPLGKQCLQMIVQFEEIEKGSYENITLSGADEQQGIGGRLLQNYNTVFKGKGIRVQMTEKVRTQQSANAFLKAFENYPQGSINKEIIPDSMDYAMRFYDLSPGYQTYKNSRLLQSRVDSLENDGQTRQVAQTVCYRLFDSGFASRLLINGIEAGTGKKKQVNGVIFTESLYDVYAVQFVIQKEIAQKGYSIDFGGAFTPGALQWLDKLNGAADFYEKGPADDAMGIQATIAAPLLADLLNSADSAATGKLNIDAVLRFTHAEAISPLATLMGIQQAASSSSNVFNYDKSWKAADIIPMSANIQWVLYSNGKSYLVKFLLNEKEAKINLPTDCFPYYRFIDVKAWYDTILHQARQKW